MDLTLTDTEVVRRAFLLVPPAPVDELTRRREVRAALQRARQQAQAKEEEEEGEST